MYPFYSADIGKRCLVFRRIISVNLYVMNRKFGFLSESA